LTSRYWLRTSVAVSLLAVVVCAIAQTTTYPQHRALDSERAVTSAQEILRGSEFGNEEEPSMAQDLMERAARWIAKRLEGLFSSEGFRDTAPAIGQLILFVLVGVLLVFVVWAAIKLAPQKRPVSAALQYGEERLAPPQQLMAWADEAEGRGDFRRAFVLLFWALLKLCDEAGLVRYTDDATNWEVLKTRKPGTHVAYWDEINESALKFDIVDYGDGAATADDTSKLRGLIERASRFGEAAA